jgi:hypothetical protein
MKKLIYLVCITNCLLPLTLSAYDVPEAMVTLHVTDEEGNPLSNVTAGASFYDVDDSTGDTKINWAHNLTDSNGKITVSGKTQSMYCYGAKQGGYYETTNLRYYSERKENGKWLPWNPTLEVVLKKIVKPVPMYARVVDIEVPVKDKPVGYDLMVGDWVAPYGKGSTSDFLFSRDSKTNSNTLRILFSNSGDGIQLVEAPLARQGSLLRSPRTAPENGYQSEWTQTDNNPDRVYVFRVRSVMNGKNEIKEAMYGKIYGDFLHFAYYLNPDKTRNLEFDRSKNLVTDQKGFERIQEN